jgi:hypothetical protein
MARTTGEGSLSRRTSTTSSHTSTATSQVIEANPIWQTLCAEQCSRKLKICDLLMSERCSRWQKMSKRLYSLSETSSEQT